MIATISISVVCINSSPDEDYMMVHHNKKVTFSLKGGFMKKFICWFVFLTLIGCSTQSVENNSSPNSSSHEDKQGITELQPLTDNGNEPTKPVDQEILLDVPIIAQNPELKYGCEVTSLAMLLQYAGIQVDKIKLADELPKDEDPVSKTKSGNITHWGNPDHGFVGDITGKTMGYAVYAGPLEQLMKQYLPDTINLTDKPFEDILKQLHDRKPVIVWTTGDYKLPDRWETWRHENEEIHTPLDLHAVVLVGFNSTHFYVNDPLSGKKAYPVEKQTFIDTWVALGKQGLSYQ
jgi:uncharacterized protein YvpB